MFRLAGGRSRAAAMAAFALVSSTAIGQVSEPMAPAEPAGASKSEAAAGEDWMPGRVLLQLRPRYTYIDQSNRPRRAQAANLRTLLGYRTDPLGDFRFTGELVNVSWMQPLNATNTPANFRSPFPVVADPDKSDVNLLFGDYTGIPDTRVRLGRQAIKLDNQRFVGDADVRQMPQVFDAVSVLNKSLSGTELFAAQSWHLRTFFGNRFESRTTLLNARTHFDFGATVGAYTYLMDQPQQNIATGFADNSSRITGLRLEGAYAATDELRWYYTAEGAVQRPYADGNALIRAGYHRFGFGPIWTRFSVLLNYERLGSNNGVYGFQMPLSFNTFQGWAYQFFSTPPEGVRDLNASVSASFGALNLWLKYHEFRPDFGSGRFGEEWDFAFDYRVTGSLSLHGVFGRFRRDASFVRPDADRYYVTLKYEY